MINIAPSRTLMERTPAFLGKAVLLAGFGFALLVVGVACAVFPQLAARLAPFLVLGVVFFVALLASKDQPLSERFRLWWLSALIVVFALWPTYMIIKVGGLPAIDARRVIAGLSILLTFYLIVSRHSVAQALLHPEPGPLKVGYWLVTFYALLRIASCAVSESPLFSLITVAWEVLYYYSMFFIAAIFFRDSSSAMRFLSLFLWLALFISLFALVERITGKNPLVLYAPKLEGLEALSLALAQTRIRDGVFRAQGTFENPLLLAEFASMAFCFAVASLLWPTTKWIRFVAFCCLIICPAAVWVSGSRAGFIALGAGAGIILMLKVFSSTKNTTVYSRSMRKIGFLFALLGALLVVTPTVMLIAQGRTATEGASTQARLTMLRLAQPSIEESPLLGKGPGVSGGVAGIKTNAGLTTLDNYFLAIAIESGLFAVAMLAAIFFFTGWTVLSALLSGRSEIPHFLAGVAGVMAVTVIFRSILWIPYNLSFVFLLTAITLGICSRIKIEQSK
ncbi:O-antigen ligase family protein [Methyloversatilis sp. XJ19-13]|uniref:O-antigen ligase family protein n=1 Tax=Methyloversatilis sp. XJ19-13 TaxID=2963430 RepID=UPI00211CC20A|nr:O-antigen ligase family protein [Methyloversatilis sp. XJ19-13]MCQ9376264.1 O-antigen ligase family protein [Methyloversatilis sp. XJ19-13]